ncbi:uncharacterized protein LOC129582331 isoform X2 [Paramacrobiotus metropolitanus]|uniref:uncharacterized protein LOC129582331 isoform X2 n=1 Tax=Paramacrobiotus metropolitanus TaxID=2943436 RepID=UPI002445DAEC|nr:uncharacterized protein LOC129582331 isoform X2 [Paramacrobiotus metropolitanus]
MSDYPLVQKTGRKRVSDLPNMDGSAQHELQLRWRLKPQDGSNPSVDLWHEVWLPEELVSTKMCGFRIADDIETEELLTTAATSPARLRGNHFSGPFNVQKGVVHARTVLDHRQSPLLTLDGAEQMEYRVVISAFGSEEMIWLPAELVAPADVSRYNKKRTAPPSPVRSPTFPEVTNIKLRNVCQEELKRESVEHTPVLKDAVANNYSRKTRRAKTKRRVSELDSDQETAADDAVKRILRQRGSMRSLSVMPKHNYGLRISSRKPVYCETDEKKEEEFVERKQEDETVRRKEVPSTSVPVENPDKTAVALKLLARSREKRNKRRAMSMISQPFARGNPVSRSSSPDDVPIVKRKSENVRRCYFDEDDSHDDEVSLTSASVPVAQKMSNEKSAEKSTVVSLAEELSVPSAEKYDTPMQCPAPEATQNAVNRSSEKFVVLVQHEMDGAVTASSTAPERVDENGRMQDDSEECHADMSMEIEPHPVHPVHVFSLNNSSASLDEGVYSEESDVRAEDMASSSGIAEEPLSEVPVFSLSGLEQGRVAKAIEACAELEMINVGSPSSKEVRFLVRYADERLPQHEAVRYDVCWKYCPQLMISYFRCMGFDSGLLSSPR